MGVGGFGAMTESFADWFLTYADSMDMNGGRLSRMMRLQEAMAEENCEEKGF
jgi:hypothetical protein